MASLGGERFLLDATIWHESMDAHSPHLAACRALVADTAYPVAALSLTLHEVTNSLGVRRRRAAEAVDICRLIVGRCGHRIVGPDPILMLSAIEIATDHDIAAYDASYVAVARREGWTLISLDIKDLVSKGLAITPDVAV